jgi:hypothetical protein
MTKNFLMNQNHNVYSQFGEDGIIKTLINQLGIRNGLFCEFGAWDGSHLSNCRNLLDLGWHGVMIEGDKKKFRKLTSNLGGNLNVSLINAFVEVSGFNSLNQILGNNEMFKEHEGLDILSIDIDGDDLNVWKNFTISRPHIVIIEYNNSIPLDLDYINPPGLNHGNSAKSTISHAKDSGYSLVSATTSNLFFINCDSIPEEFAYDLPEIYDLHIFAEQQRFFFTYDGAVISSKAGNHSLNEIFVVPWTTFLSSQFIPKSLRKLSRLPRFKFIYSTLKLLIFRPTLFKVIFRLAVKVLKNYGY